MPLEPFLALFLVQYFRKTLSRSAESSKWSTILTYSLYGVVILFAADIFVPKNYPTIWVWHLLLVLIIYVVYKNETFHFARAYMLAIVPYVALSLFIDILKLLPSDLFGVVTAYGKTILPFTIIWIFALLLISRRQQKILMREREKRKAEEEENRVIAARKLELEQMVAERTVELTQQKTELENAVVELKSTQAQLIQSEKMASLGELTAGIAHEIQNPLNFVNNFSDVSAELLDEMQEALQKDDKAEVLMIAADIKDNLQKITFHGKRADAIVKGMLQHSRSSNGQKEPTNINAVCDEYLRLSYHGLRAKDKSFNAAFTTHFDDTIDMVNIVPQDFGRVIMNLLTNAFYAVNERKQMNIGKYEPTVSISTKRLADKVLITVKDNGNGIPQKVLDKIYQPFFTTKPAGQGTGLGLSLSYDIIKANGGEIKVNTEVVEGAEFIITLPSH